MCWPHANRKIKDHLKPITSINKTLSQQVLEDVETFQWIVTPSSFEKDLKSLENKYLKERESTEQVPAVQAAVVQVQEVPGQEEVQGHEVQVPAVQEVVQEDSRVTCTFCHSKVSKKSLKGHERTQKCTEVPLVPPCTYTEERCRGVCSLPSSHQEACCTWL